MFLGKDEAKGKWKEWEIQAYIIQEARREGYFIEGDQNQAKRSFGAAARAKVCGMQSGTPDIRILKSPNRMIFIELKVLKNSLSQPQIEWHDLAKWNGFEVHTIYSDTPLEAWQQVKEILK